MFKTNARVRDELFQARPKERAIALLIELKDKLTIASHKEEMDAAIREVRSV